MIERNDCLPPGWALTTLGDAFKWTSGGTPNTSNRSFYGGDIPWTVSGDLNDRMITSVPSSITPAGLIASSAKWVEPGSVLIAMYGATIGKLGIAGVRLTTNQAIAFTDPFPVDTKYLFYHLMSQRKALVQSGIGAAQNNISQTIIKAHPFVVAPLLEQHRIVAEIEIQFSRLDAAVAALKRVQANLKRYRAAILRAACEGRLVPTEAELARQEGRDYEPADGLLQRILRERRAQWEADQLAKMEVQGRLSLNDTWKAKYQEPAAPDTTCLPELPEGWSWTSLGQAFEVYVGATPSRGRPEYWNGTISWVSSGEVAFCRIYRTRETITEAGLRNSSTNVHLSGTVLLGMIGEGKTRGQVAILAVPACNNQNCAAIRVSQSGLPPEFVYYFLWSQYEKTRQVGSGNNQPALNKTKVENMIFPLPPLVEQHRIVAEVERRLSIVEGIEAMVAADLKRAERLRQAFLQRAFSGKLVPQDPHDEPASALLEEIRSDRQANDSVVKKASVRQPRAIQIDMNFTEGNHVDQ